MTVTTHTATVSDEAVHAIDRFSEAAKSWGWVEDQGSGSTIVESENEFKAARENLDAVVAALTAALPHLALSSAPCSVEVTKLDWRNNTAETSFGDYDIYNDADEAMADCPICASHPDGIVGHFASEAEAKSAAQADFDRRILSQIITKTVDVAAGREKLYREAYEDAVTDALNICGKFDDISLAEIESGIKALQPDPKIIRVLSPAEPVDQSRVAQLEAALTSILFEDSDKSEQQRMIDRVKARAILEQSEPVDQWQDIATAEKRAFDVILRVFCKGSGTGYREVIGHYAEDLSGSEQPPFKGWFSDSGNGNGFRQISPDPTHWRRLSPAAPTSKGGA